MTQDPHTRGATPGRLARLDELDDYEVADHDPDPRGWEVVGRDGVRIGEVDHLIGDTGTMKVHYLTVDVDDDHDERQILVPASHARLEDERVRVDALDARLTRDVPVYRGTLDETYERDLRAHFDGRAHDR